VKPGFCGSNGSLHSTKPGKNLFSLTQDRRFYGSFSSSPGIAEGLRKIIKEFMAIDEKNRDNISKAIILRITSVI
jgi:hypothetical protein